MASPSTTKSPAVDVKGHCYCGAVEFQVTMNEGDSPLFPPCYCHCDSCRRAHAAPLYHVVCLDGGKHFKITKGQEHVKKFQKPNNPTSGLLNRCFCDICGTRILNEFKPDLPFWPDGTTYPIAIFPNTFEASVASNLPEVFRAKRHHEAQDCVLDLELISKANASPEKADWEE